MFDAKPYEEQRLLSGFKGIRIYLDYVADKPPFITAVYNEEEAEFLIEDGIQYLGEMYSGHQLKLVLAWLVIHEAELMENWELAKANKPLKEIPPLS